MRPGGRGGLGRALASTLLLLGAALGCGHAEDAPPDAAITAAELTARLEAGDAPFVLDVRTPEEFAGGHIPGAVNIPHTELPARLDELAAYKDSEIVVTCERGGRAHSAEVVLSAGGFERVRDLSGHMSGWREGHLPVE